MSLNEKWDLTPGIVGMWQPDIATLRMILGFAGLLSLLVALGLWRVERGAAGTGAWLLAATLGLAACLLPPAVIWRQPDLGIVANTSLTLAAMVLILEGALSFRAIGDPAHRRLPLVMAILAIVALMLAAAGRPWIRIVLHDGLAAVLLCAAACVLAWNAAKGHRAVSAVLALSFVGLGLLYVWRGSGLLARGLDLGGADTRMPPWLLAASLVWLLVWTAGMPLLLLLRGRDREIGLINRDGLTGLSSRVAFMRQSAAELVCRGGQGQGAGILLLSLEGLRPMNEGMGHEAGDRMLKAFADRLHVQAKAEGGLSGRLTGAQFAMLLPVVGDRAGLMQAMERVRRSMMPPVTLGDVMQSPSFSIGTALYPEDGRTIAALLEVAERAMFKVKAVGAA